jgi:hypothetical protein
MRTLLSAFLLALAAAVPLSAQISAVPPQDPCRDPIYLAMRRVDVGLMTKAEYEAFHLREYACAQYVAARTQPIRQAQARPADVQRQAATVRDVAVTPTRSGAPLSALDRGSLLLGGQAHFESTGESGDDEFDFRVSRLSINPALQYFVAPGLAVGGELIVERIALGELASTTIGIGPRLGYYFGGAGAAVHPFIATSGTFYYSPTDESTAIGVRPSLGLLVMLARSVGITGEGFFRYDAALSEGEGSTNTFGFAAGLAAFLF